MRAFSRIFVILGLITFAAVNIFMAEHLTMMVTAVGAADAPKRSEKVRSSSSKGSDGWGNLLENSLWDRLVTVDGRGDIVTSEKRLIIGSGFGKTGTTSLAAALRILGYTRTLHWTPELFVHAGSSWSAIDWKRFESVDAVLDFPTPEYTLELIKIFPRSLVILTVRDGESWLESHANHFHSGGPNPGESSERECLNHLGQHVHRLCGSAISSEVEALGHKTSLNLGDLLGAMNNCPIVMARFLSFGTLCPSRAQALKRMYLHILAIQREVPSERLLMMNLERGDGWSDLCPFLGLEKDCTSAEFPIHNVHVTPPSAR